MKKSKALAAAMTAIIATGAVSGCDYHAKDNIEQAFYGPPPINDRVNQQQSDDTILDIEENANGQ